MQSYGHLVQPGYANRLDSAGLAYHQTGRVECARLIGFLDGDVMRVRGAKIIGIESYIGHHANKTDHSATATSMTASTPKHSPAARDVLIIS